MFSTFVCVFCLTHNSILTFCKVVFSIRDRLNGSAVLDLALASKIYSEFQEFPLSTLQPPYIKTRCLFFLFVT